MHNICTKFHANTFDNFDDIEGTVLSLLYHQNCQIYCHTRVITIAKLKITQMLYSMINVDKDMFLFLCTPSDDSLYFNQNL